MRVRRRKKAHLLARGHRPTNPSKEHHQNLSRPIKPFCSLSRRREKYNNWKSGMIRSNDDAALLLRNKKNEMISRFAYLCYFEASTSSAEKKKR